MRLATYNYKDQIRYGVVRDDVVIDLQAAWGDLQLPGEGPDSLRGLVAQGREGLALVAAELEAAAAEGSLSADHQVAADQVSYLPPIPNPPKLLCLAGNYMKHIQEGKAKPVEFHKRRPDVFMKPPTTTLRGSGEAVTLSRDASFVDWEIELAVVIGERARYLTEENAMDVVAGYTILNDLSERELAVGPEREPSARGGYFDWLNGKWFDGFAPCGPYLVTADEVEDPHDLRLVLEVNGVVEQDGSTGQMIYRIPEVLAFASAIMTLEPGDIIATGTPHGVGKAKGKQLHPGDKLVARIEGLGRLETPIYGYEEA